MWSNLQNKFMKYINAKASPVYDIALDMAGYWACNITGQQAEKIKDMK